MAETSKPSYVYTWASGGAKQTLTQTIIQQGWTVAKPSFQRANAVESRQDLMLQHIDQHGIPVWSSDTEYFANKSWVTGSNGELYRAVADSIGVNPVGDTSNKWYRVLDEFFTKTQSDARYLALAVPSGAVVDFAMQTAPAGYLVCNGGAISRAAFPALFDAIGTLYGNGDGSTTFNLPDYRGTFRRSFDAGKGVDVGRVFGSYQADAFTEHSHNIAVGGGAEAGPYIDGSSEVFTENRATTLVGGSETRPKNYAVLTCIKV